LSQAAQPSERASTGPPRAATHRILLLGEPPPWQPAPAPLDGHEPLALEIVVADPESADRLLAAGAFEVAVVNLTREASARLEAVRRLRRSHPRTAWLALTGPEPMLAEEVMLRAGILEEIPDSAVGHGLSRAVRRALARRDALPPPEPPPWDSPPIQATRLASLGVVAAGVAHEINNPLAYVRSNLEFVVDEFGSLQERLVRLVRRFPNVAGGATGFPDLARQLRELREAMDEANEGVTRLAEVVGGLKQFSSRPRTEIGDVDLREVVRSSLRIAARTVSDRARLETRLEAVPRVRGCAAYLGQVVLNLLVNAAQALSTQTPPGGGEDVHRVRIATFERGGSAVLEVSDTGPGMSEDVARRIFEPFFTTKPPGQGTGLGLTVSRQVVETFGGTLGVETAEGQGTTFRVVLPPATG
jgi:signal transduction histidine kinase